MENEWEAAYRLSAAMQMRESDRYSYSLLQEQKRMIEENMKRHWENQYLQSFSGAFHLDDVQRAKDITDQITAPTFKTILEGLDYEPELAMRVSNVTDITALSHDIRRSCVHGVHLRYERQQNRLDIYFEKAQDYVLVKMFTE